MHQLASGDARAQAEIFAKLARRLAAAGADAVAVTSMGGHFCSRELEAVSPLPVINAIPAVNEAIRQRGLQTIGIDRNISSDAVAALWRSHLGEHRAAGRRGLAAGARGISRDGVRGPLHHRTAARGILSAGRQMMREQGADAIMLGGTDLFLSFAGQNPGFPLVDCAAIHIGAIYQRSVRAA